MRAEECGTAVPDVSMDENNVRGGLKSDRGLFAPPIATKKHTHSRGEESFSWGTDRDTHAGGKHTPTAIDDSINKVMDL